MPRLSWALAVALLAVAAAAAHVSATSPNCDPAYECGFRTTAKDGSTYKFDFSSLCSDKDYVLKDQKGHSYHANICGSVQAPCRPGTFAARVCFGGILNSCCRCSFVAEHVRIRRDDAVLGPTSILRLRFQGLLCFQRHRRVLHGRLPGAGNRRPSVVPGRSHQPQDWWRYRQAHWCRGNGL